MVQLNDEELLNRIIEVFEKQELLESVTTYENGEYLLAFKRNIVKIYLRGLLIQLDVTPPPYIKLPAVSSWDRLDDLDKRLKQLEIRGASYG